MNSSSCKAQCMPCVFSFAELEVAWLLAIKTFPCADVDTRELETALILLQQVVPVLPPSPCWFPHNILLKWAGVLLVFPEGARWAKASNLFVLLRCFFSDVVDKNGLHSCHCCTQVSPHLSQYLFQSEAFSKKACIPEKNPLWMILGLMQPLQRWWGYNLMCQRKTCDGSWEKTVDPRKMGWMSRECFRDKCLCDALLFQFGQERAAIGFVVYGLWYLLGGLFLSILWCSFLSYLSCAFSAGSWEFTSLQRFIKCSFRGVSIWKTGVC